MKDNENKLPTIPLETVKASHALYMVRDMAELFNMKPDLVRYYLRKNNINGIGQTQKYITASGPVSRVYHERELAKLICSEFAIRKGFIRGLGFMPGCVSEFFIAELSAVECADTPQYIDEPSEPIAQKDMSQKDMDRFFAAMEKDLTPRRQIDEEKLIGSLTIIADTMRFFEDRLASLEGNVMQFSQAFAIYAEAKSSVTPLTYCKNRTTVKLDESSELVVAVKRKAAFILAQKILNDNMEVPMSVLEQAYSLARA